MALGARVNETVLREPEDHDVNGVLAEITLPNHRKPRALMAAALPFGSVPGIAPLSMDVNDPHTMMCSCKQRLMRRTPKPNVVLLAELKTFVKSWLAKNLNPVEPMEFEEWLASTGYNEHRKEQLREASTTLQGGRPSPRQCRKVEMHGKHESYPEYKHARTINSRCDAFKAYSGPYFKAIEAELYRLPYFVKHMTPAERMERVKSLSSVGNRCYATDFTAFESHFSHEIMHALEIQLYKYCLQHYPRDSDIIVKTIGGKNLISTRCGFYAKVFARRMSGDMCTSLGNGFSNIMLALFIAHKKGAHLDGIVEGDDGLFVTDKEMHNQDWLDLGFTIKMTPVPDPCRASFCGLIFGESGQVIRDPVRFLQNFGWTENYITGSERVHMELLRAKSLSALHETPQCPIVGMMARCAYQRTTGYMPRFTDRWRAMHTPDWAEEQFAPSPDTRQLFQEMYGVGVEQQLAIEAMISAGDMGFAHLLKVHPHIADYESRFVERLIVSTNKAVRAQLSSFASHAG